MKQRIKKIVIKVKEEIVTSSTPAVLEITQPEITKPVQRQQMKSSAPPKKDEEPSITKPVVKPVFKKEEFQDFNKFKEELRPKEDDKQFSHRKSSSEHEIETPKKDPEPEVKEEIIEEIKEIQENNDKSKKTRPTITKKPKNDQVLLRYTNFEDENYSSLYNS